MSKCYIPLYTIKMAALAASKQAGARWVDLEHEDQHAGTEWAKWIHEMGANSFAMQRAMIANAFVGGTIHFNGCLGGHHCQYDWNPYLLAPQLVIAWCQKLGLIAQCQKLVLVIVWQHKLDHRSEHQSLECNKTHNATKDLIAWSTLHDLF